MKTLLCFFLVLAQLAVFGQWNSTGNNSTTGELTVGSATTVGGTALDVISNETNHVSFMYNQHASGNGLMIRTAVNPLRVVPYAGAGTAPDLFSIISSGNVGIGTSSPSAKLEVVGDVIVGNYDGGTGYGSKMHFYPPNSDPVWIARYNPTSNQSQLRLNIGDDAGQQQDAFVIGTHHWNGDVWVPHMSVHATGFVGIGTTNPDEKLAVKGKIHAEEVRVDLSVPGPDYVFSADYKLPTLEELRKFIAEEKHLPGVPAAKEMEVNGINVGEMNMILLEKIEELTLYLIQVKTELDEVKRKLK